MQFLKDDDNQATITITLSYEERSLLVSLVQGELDEVVGDLVPHTTHAMLPWHAEKLLYVEKLQAMLSRINDPLE